jgi:hypothetical protein
MTCLVRRWIVIWDFSTDHNMKSNQHGCDILRWIYLWICANIVRLRTLNHGMCTCQSSMTSLFLILANHHCISLPEFPFAFTSPGFRFPGFFIPVRPLHEYLIAALPSHCPISSKPQKTPCKSPRNEGLSHACVEAYEKLTSVSSNVGKSLVSTLSTPSRHGCDS